MKRCLITGCAGFIASHLAGKLLKEGYHVTGLDNMATGSWDNISDFFSHRNFKFIPYDVTNQIFIAGELDYILHFASAASPIDYQKLSIETLKVGSIGTINCLELAKDKKATVLLASTSEIYGDPLEHPQKEGYYGHVNSIGERSCYDEAKRFLEAVTMAYHNKEKIDVRIVRIFNTFGERMRLNDGRAVAAFFNQAIKGEPITIYGDGSQTRSFGYIDDTIDGIYKLMLSDYCYPMNIGNPEEISVNQLAKEILYITNSESKIEHLPLPKDDPKVRCPNIDLAKKILDWQPKISRLDGLKRTYPYFKNKIEEQLVKKN